VGNGADGLQEGAPHFDGTRIHRRIVDYENGDVAIALKPNEF
jgi:hypothetical protein